MDTDWTFRAHSDDTERMICRSHRLCRAGFHSLPIERIYDGIPCVLLMLRDVLSLWRNPLFLTSLMDVYDFNTNSNPNVWLRSNMNLQCRMTLFHC